MVFEEQYKLSLKSLFKQAVKNNDYQIFLILFVFTLVLFLKLETGEKVQRVHLSRDAVGQKPKAFETRSQSFNPWLIL